MIIDDNCLLTTNNIQGKLFFIKLCKSLDVICVLCEFRE